MKKPRRFGDFETSLPRTDPPPRPGSGIRRLFTDARRDDAARDAWLDCQLRLTADLLHLRMRLETQFLGGARRVAWARRLLESLELLKDALYEISADALAPPLAPLLTASSALTRETRALYAWSDDVVAWLVLHLHGPRLRQTLRPGVVPSFDAIAPAPLDDAAQIDVPALPAIDLSPLPQMPSIARVVDELEATLGADHPLFVRAKLHVNEAYLMALAIDAELANARKDATEGRD